MRLKRVRRVEAMFRAGPGFAEAVRDGAGISTA